MKAAQNIRQNIVHRKVIYTLMDYTLMDPISSYVAIFRLIHFRFLMSVEMSWGYRY